MAACRQAPMAESLPCSLKPWPAGVTCLRARRAGDGSCKLWDGRTLACLHALAGESGGATSCHLALTGATEAPELFKTVLVRPPHRPRRMQHNQFLSAEGV